MIFPSVHTPSTSETMRRMSVGREGMSGQDTSRRRGSRLICFANRQKEDFMFRRDAVSLAVVYLFAVGAVFGQQALPGTFESDRATNVHRQAATSTHVPVATRVPVNFA